MKQEGSSVRRILLAAVLMLLQCFVLTLYMGFQSRRTVWVVAVAGIILNLVGLQLVKEGERTQTKKYLLFHLSSIGILCLALHSIGQACYLEEMTYFKWLIKRGSLGRKNSDFELGTCLMVSYFIFLAVYGQVIIGLAKENVIRWLPSLECIILGLYLYIALNTEYSHSVKNGALFVTSGLLSIYHLFRAARSNEEKTKLSINLKYYLLVCVMAIFFVAGVAYYLPTLQELPGTRTLHHWFNGFKDKTDLAEWVPSTINLSNEVPMSEAEIFELQASEPLYLRDIAYNDYEDGKWSIREDLNFDKFIPFKEKYLEAEYSQEKALINEISWLNSQDASLLPEYAWLGNYESSVETKRSYIVIQNPINKINYFTVNGFNDIQDEGISQYYYYHNLHNDYFYSKHLVEPSGYQVTYTDRVPKIGSREYIFLQEMNGEKWQALYDEVMEARQLYHKRYDGTPKLLMTYTQMIQYKNAVYGFTQVPDELKDKLKLYAEEIVGEEKSDWGRAKRLQDYLKTNYGYNLQKQKIEGDRVLSFLEDRKEGICQDFATSMTLMCRSLGMPAKYVTGYLVKDKSEQTGNYIVKEKDAHAFVEVYIAGYGWMTFDPTPANEEKAEEILDEPLQMSDVINFLGTIVIVVLLFVISGSGRNYLKEKWWKLKYYFSKPDEKNKILLAQYMRLLTAYGYSKSRYETLSQFTERLMTEKLDITSMTRLYEKQKYGMQKPTKEELLEVKKRYERLKKELKKLDKNK